MELRDHVFLGMTQSLCPGCLRLVSAKIIEREGRIYFRKRCAECGPRDDFVCSDRSQFDRMEYSLPGRVPRETGVEPERGCPYDCGLCTEHEQHTCIGLVEITDSCNLECPMCYAASGPGGKHRSLEDCQRAIDRLVEVEGRPEVLQLSGGEPTIHPEFLNILKYACRQPIDVVMINTNGLRLAKDAAFVDAVAASRDPGLEVYLQFDGFRESTYETLRGEPLLEIKLAAVEALGRVGVPVTLVATLQPGVNEDEIGDIIRFGLERPWIAGVSLQPATYSGRHVLPEVLERRLTFPDVVKAIATQTEGLFEESDFLPLPCAHPNCHTLTYAYRSGDQVLPIPRFMDVENNLDLFANGISFTRPRARALMSRYLESVACDPGRCFPAGEVPPLARDFFARVLGEELSARDIFRITITSFLDAYNFDVRRVMKCCIHHVLPGGHIIPFCAYNVLYRDGHVPLPPLRTHETSLESE